MGSSVATDYLVATPSAVTGLGSIMNLSGGYFIYNTAPTGEEADMAAIRRDWLKTAQDMKEAARVSIAQAASGEQKR